MQNVLHENERKNFRKNESTGDIHLVLHKDSFCHRQKSTWNWPIHP